jgi:hypothetical protein
MLRAQNLFSAVSQLASLGPWPLHTGLVLSIEWLARPLLPGFVDGSARALSFGSPKPAIPASVPLPIVLDGGTLMLDITWCSVFLMMPCEYSGFYF